MKRWRLSFKGFLRWSPSNDNTRVCLLFPSPPLLSINRIFSMILWVRDPDGFVWDRYDYVLEYALQERSTSLTEKDLVDHLASNHARARRHRCDHGLCTYSLQTGTFPRSQCFGLIFFFFFLDTQTDHLLMIFGFRRLVIVNTNQTCSSSSIFSSLVCLCWCSEWTFSLGSRVSMTFLTVEWWSYVILSQAGPDSDPPPPQKKNILCSDECSSGCGHPRSSWTSNHTLLGCDRDGNLIDHRRCGSQVRESLTFFKICPLFSEPLTWLLPAGPKQASLSDSYP